jgi:deoxyribonuclease IV
MRVGAHVPTRGRLARALDYAETIGADAIQLFVSNPRAWSPPSLRHSAVDEFRDRLEASPVGEVFVHSTYLINVASPDPAFHRRSIELAQAELAGAGAVASTIPQAAELLEAVDDPRVGLVLDTCHLLGAGYPLDDPAEATRPFDEFRDLGLSERLGLVHGNDARDPRGARRDRHEHPGKGTIGPDGFRALLADPLVRDRSVLVETRGREPEHTADVAALRDLAGSV